MKTDDPDPAFRRSTTTGFLKYMLPIAACLALAMMSVTAHAQTAASLGCVAQKAGEGGDAPVRAQKAGEGGDGARRGAEGRRGRGCACRGAEGRRRRGMRRSWRRRPAKAGMRRRRGAEGRRRWGGDGALPQKAAEGNGGPGALPRRQPKVRVVRCPESGCRQAPKLASAKPDDDSANGGAGGPPFAFRRSLPVVDRPTAPQSVR